MFAGLMLLAPADRSCSARDTSSLPLPSPASTLGHPYACTWEYPRVPGPPLADHQLPEHHAQKDDRDPKENCFFAVELEFTFALTNPATCRKKKSDLAYFLFFRPLLLFLGVPFAPEESCRRFAPPSRFAAARAIANPHLVRCRSEAKVIRLQGLLSAFAGLFQQYCQANRARLCFRPAAAAKKSCVTHRFPAPHQPPARPGLSIPAPNRSKLRARA